MTEEAKSAESNEFDSSSNGNFDDEDFDLIIKDDDDIDIYKNDINIMREKTFNEDLRKLVSKVTKTEDTGSQENIPHYSDALEKISEQNLLLKLHQLYYEVKNFKNLKDVNASFEPFCIDGSFDNFQNFIRSYIDGEFKKLSLPQYSILTYNFDKKCFLPELSTIEKIDNTDIYFGINDNLIKEIHNSYNGYFLKRDLIKNDKFLNKRFSEVIDDNFDSFYFIHISNLINVPIEDLNRNLENSYYIPNTSILMVKVNKDVDKAKIYGSLVKRLALVMMFVEENLIIRYDSDSPDYNRLIYLFEYLFQVYPSINGKSCVLIKLDNNYSREIILTLKYIYAKIFSFTAKDSIILRLKQDVIFLITNDSKIRLIEDLISEYNSLYDNSFNIEVIPFDESLSFNSIIQKIYS
ncbi:hypothetical protein ACFL20_08690 [Spirochaetota bacterium]